MAGRLKWHQRLHIDRFSLATGNAAWDEARGNSLIPGNCTWDMAHQLIRGLNGRDRTVVFLGYMGDEGIDRQLSIAGGNQGRYLVAVQEPARYYFLVHRLRPSRSGELVEVIDGGLPAFYPRVLIHPLGFALIAAEHYFRTGRRSRKLSWMRGDVAERLRRRAEEVELFLRPNPSRTNHRE